MHQPALLTAVIYSDFTGIFYVIQMCSYLHQHIGKGKTEKVSSKQATEKSPSSLLLDIWLSIGKEINTL